MLKKMFSLFSLTSSQRQEIHREINLFEAMQAHAAWKKRLHDYVENRSGEELQPHQVGMDNRCVLGKWIHGPGKEHFGDEPLFRQLEEEHAKFHYHASKVVEAYQAGNKALTERLLSDNFAEQSRKTVNCLARINAMVEGKEPTDQQLTLQTV